MSGPHQGNQSFRAFLSFLAGIVAADSGNAGDAFLSVSLVLCLVAILMRVRGPRLFGRAHHCFPPLLRPAVVLLLVFMAGAMRFEASRVDDWAFAGRRNTEVRALVVVERMLRRDVSEVAAEVRVSGGLGPGDTDRGRRTVLRCFPGADDESGSCDEISTGATLATGGLAVLLEDGRTAVLAGTGTGILRVYPGGAQPGPAGALDSLRASMSRAARQSFEGPASWLIPAVVLGEGRGVPPVVRRAMSMLGVSHLLSVSGLHVVTAAGIAAVLAAILLGLPASILFPRFNLAAFTSVVAVAAAWAVCMLAGSPPSATRAAGMATAFVAATFLRRRVPAEAIIALVGLVNLLKAPDAALSLSFQLSYAAVYGIVLSMRALRLSRPARIGASKRHAGVFRVFFSRVGDSLVVSTGAVLATMPLTVVYFGSAPLVAPVVNLFVVPVFSFFVFPGALAAAVLVRSVSAPGHGACGFFLSAWSRGVDLFMDFLSRGARVLPGWAAMPVFPLDAAVAALSLFVILLLVPGERFVRLARAAVPAILLLLFGHWNPPPVPGVVFLDTGKGDAALIRCPSGQSWLVDTGPPPASSDRLLRALTRERVSHIDGVILTHAHDDHYGGLATVLDACGPVKVAASARTISRIDGLVRAVRAAGGTVHTVGVGDELIPGCGIGTEVLRAGGPPSVGENDASLVFRLGLPGTGILFTGDMESDGEAALIASGANLSAAILKVGHHGSPGGSSPDFIRAVGAGTVIVTGWPRGSRQGPSPVVLDRFLQAGSGVESTALLGDITIEMTVSGKGKSERSPVFKPRKGFPRIGFVRNDQITGMMLKVKRGAGPRQD